MLAYIVPIEGGEGGQPDQGLPGQPPHIWGGGTGGSGGLPPGWWTKPPDNSVWPIPPLPGIWPAPGTPTLPIYLPPSLWPPRPDPPGVVKPPIYINGSPTLPITLPPGVYPPLPPHEGTGRYAILIWVVGLGFRWLVVEPGPQPEPKK